MTSLILAFASCLAATAAPPPAPDPAAVYRAVLEHVRTGSDSGPATPLVLDPAVYPGISGRTGETHTAEVLGRLRAGDRVRIGCREDAATAECPAHRGKYVSVSLGRVVELPDSARVKVVQEERTPGIPLPAMLARIPDSLAVPADAAVDVVIHEPCPASPDSERCRVPDIHAYRYFLRAGPGDTYLVVTRWPTGAV